MRIGVIVAMEKELTQIVRLFSDATERTIDGQTFTVGHLEGDKEIVVMQCGIGKVNAAIGTVELIKAFAPQLVISTGVAGGADTTLNVRDVVVSTACCYHDAYCGTECAYGQILGMPERFPTPESLTQVATNLQCNVTVRPGLIVSGDWFVDSREKMSDILSHFPEAMAVDMESCAIAQTCHAKSTPFVSFRIISDVPLKDCKAEMYYNFWEQMAEGSFEVTKAFLMQLA